MYLIVSKIYFVAFDAKKVVNNKNSYTNVIYVRVFERKNWRQIFRDWFCKIFVFFVIKLISIVIDIIVINIAFIIVLFSRWLLIKNVFRFKYQ